MLDADLAEIYGYDTKGFNRQVKNNIEKYIAILVMGTKINMKIKS